MDQRNDAIKRSQNSSRTTSRRQGRRGTLPLQYNKLYRESPPKTVRFLVRFAWEQEDIKAILI